MNRDCPSSFAFCKALAVNFWIKCNLVQVERGTMRYITADMKPKTSSSHWANCAERSAFIWD